MPAINSNDGDGRDQPRKQVVWSVFSPAHLEYIHSVYCQYPQPSCYYYGRHYDSELDEAPASPISLPLARLPLPPGHDNLDELIESVREAIDQGVHPKRIYQGSSGSYFCQQVEPDPTGQPSIRTCGVFKPKDEEPYGNLNPKWTKWIHRNLFPCFFGRSCIIPNLGYISETAASILDQRLGLNIVPVTRVVSLASPAFHYSYFDRRAAKSRTTPRPLPEKIGSFQIFLHDYQNADRFLARYPWDTRDAPRPSCDPSYCHLPHSSSLASGPAVPRAHTTPPFSGNHHSRGHSSPPATCPDESQPLLQDHSGWTGSPHITLQADEPEFVWTPDTRQQFFLEVEKLVLLDYLMRNTDRGLDNWMIRVCRSPTCPESRLDAPAYMSSRAGYRGPSNEFGYLRPIVSHHHHHHRHNSISRELLLRTRITTSSSENTLYYNAAITQLPFHVHIAAIDNGLAFPFKHPDEWRSYPYGWLYLPSSLIDRPFSSAIRAHLLPVLCDPVWWTQTVEALRGVFSLDSDFNERMFSRQIGIIKAQALNIIRTLLSPGQGPMDLCRRPLLIIDEVSVKSDLADYYYSNTACWVTVQNNTPVGSAQRELFAASSGQESPSRRRGVPKSNRNNEISHSLSGSAPANFSVDDLHLHTTVNTSLHNAPRAETSLRRVHSIPNCKSPSSDSGGNLPHNGLRGSDGNGDGHPIEVPASPRTSGTCTPTPQLGQWRCLSQSLLHGHSGIRPDPLPPLLSLAADPSTFGLDESISKRWRQAWQILKCKFSSKQRQRLLEGQSKVQLVVERVRLAQDAQPFFKCC